MLERGEAALQTDFEPGAIGHLLREFLLDRGRAFAAEFKSRKVPQAGPTFSGRLHTTSTASFFLTTTAAARTDDSNATLRTGGGISACKLEPAWDTTGRRDTRHTAALAACR